MALLNAPGNGAADDKGIYYFVPKMIRYYLDQEPILQNAPTYLPFYEKDRQFVLEHFDRLVLKDVAEAGGYGVVFAERMTAEENVELPPNLPGEYGRRSAGQRVWEALERVGLVETRAS